MDPFLLQTVGLSSDYDAVHFGSDLVREEDEIHGMARRTSSSSIGA